MDPNKANDYKAVTEMLLREFKLSPSVYLDKFNTDVRKQDETYLLYSARLAAILDAYLDSRKIGKSYVTSLQNSACCRVGHPDRGVRRGGRAGGSCPPPMASEKNFLTWTVQTEMSIICSSFSDSHVGS